MSIITTEKINTPILTNQECRYFYTQNGVAQRIVDWHIDIPMSVGRRISFNDLDDKLKLFEELSQKLDIQNVVTSACKNALIFGEASLYVLVESDDEELSDPSKPLFYHKLSAKDNIRLLSVDPLNASSPTILNALNIKYLDKTATTIKNVLFHESRIIVLRNKMPMYLEFTNSSYQYTGRSIYQTCYLNLKSIEMADAGLQRVISKIGLLVHKNATQDSNNQLINTGAQERVLALRKMDIDDALNNDVLTILDTENLEFLNCSDVTLAIKEAQLQLRKNIGVDTGTPHQILCSETLSTSMAEGQADFSMIIQALDINRQVLIKPAYEFCDKILLGLLSNENDQHEYEELVQNFNYEFNVLEPQLASEKLKELELKVDLIFKTYEVTGDEEFLIDALGTVLEKLVKFKPKFKKIPEREDFKQYLNNASSQFTNNKSIPDYIKSFSGKKYEQTFSAK